MRIKAFTERNPVIIGVIVVALVAAGTTAALALNAGVFKSRYTVHARFPDTAGLRNGDDIRVAGVYSGEVGSVRQDGASVLVDLKIDDGVKLPQDVRAEIVVETVLGKKYVRLVAGDRWDDPLEAGDTITDTVTPTEVLDVIDAGTPLLDQSDAPALNDLLGKLARITEGQRGDVGEIITGLTRLTRAVNDRQAEARRLIDASRVVTGTLAERDEQLLEAMADLDVVLDGLARRRVQLVALLENTESAARRTADLVAENRPAIDTVLTEIHEDLRIVSRRQDELAQSLSGMANAISGFASVGYSGKELDPNQWANMYTQMVGPLSPDALFGSCGLFDDAFDVMLGPDPITDCEQRDGPLPSAVAAESDQGGGSPGGDEAAEQDPLTTMYGGLVEEGG